MAVGVFPAVKLGVLFLKQISKPLAKVIAEQAKNHPVFRTYFIIPPAQFYHWAEVKAKMYVMNLGKPANVTKLNEQMAMELGANLMGEIIIFSVATGCLILEYRRQTAKEAEKESVRQAQLEKFTNDISRNEAEIAYLKMITEELAKKSKLDVEKLKPATPPPAKEVSSDNTKEKSSVKDKSETVNKATDKESIVQRAIVYYEKDVKGNKPS